MSLMHNNKQTLRYFNVAISIDFAPTVTVLPSNNISFLFFVLLCFSRCVSMQKHLLHFTACTVSKLYWKNATDTKPVAGAAARTESRPRGETHRSSACWTHTLYGGFSEPVICRIKKPLAPFESHAYAYTTRYLQYKPLSCQQHCRELPTNTQPNIKHLFSAWRRFTSQDIQWSKTSCYRAIKHPLTYFTVIVKIHVMISTLPLL